MHPTKKLKLQRSGDLQLWLFLKAVPGHNIGWRFLGHSPSQSTGTIQQLAPLACCAHPRKRWGGTPESRCLLVERSWDLGLWSSLTWGRSRSWGGSRAGPGQTTTQQMQKSSPYFAKVHLLHQLGLKTPEFRGTCVTEIPGFNSAGRHRAGRGLLSLCPQWCPPQPWPPDLGSRVRL